jgi:voltage-gated potassium channel
MKENEVQTAFERYQSRAHEIVFEADTAAGRLFDVALIATILLSVVVVMLDSVQSMRAAYGPLLHAIEWFLTILFTLEYLLRLSCVGRPLHYARSFFGIVDLLAILPTYLSLIFPGSHYLLVVRLLRVLRIFRVLKVARYIGEADLLMDALHNSRRKIFIFLFAVLTLATIAGSLMYVVEGAESGFTSIPTSIYWAIVTLTTVGYGDISPVTPPGQFIATCIMLMGYGIIAVPTGIMSVEIARATERRDLVVQACRECGGHCYHRDAKYCMHCGVPLEF